MRQFSNAKHRKSFIGGDRQSGLVIRKHECLKTFPGIGNRPVTSRSQESSSARMLVRWFFIAYDLDKSCLSTGLIIATFVNVVNKKYYINHLQRGGHL